MRISYKIYLLLIVMSTILLGGCAGTEGGKKTEEKTKKTEEKIEDSYIEEVDSAPQAENREPSIESEELSSENEEPSIESGEPFDGVIFEGQDMEGNVVSSAVFAESKLTMVNVWATYCNPCLREMPGLGELAKEYDSEEFQIIGIISDVQTGSDQRMMDLAADLIEQTGAEYPHLPINESIYYALLTDVTAVPTTFFVDGNGTVLDTVIGSMEKSTWKEIIDALLEEQ